MKVSSRISFGNIDSNSQFYRDIEKEVEFDIKSHQQEKAKEILRLYNTANKVTPFYEVEVMPYYSIVDYVSNDKPLNRIRSVSTIKFYPYCDSPESTKPYTHDVKYIENCEKIVPIIVNGETKYNVRAKVGGGNDVYGLGGIKARLQDVIRIGKKLQAKDREKVKRLHKYEKWYMKTIEQINKYRILADVYQEKAEALQEKLSKSHFE